MTSKEKRKWGKKLHPFWVLRDIAYDKFRKREYEIEKAMSKLSNEELEFVYCDNECCGIGHSDFKRRHRKRADYFPLLQREDLE